MLVKLKKILYFRQAKCGENSRREIKKHRMDLGLFQKDVTKFIGVSTDTITYWERGRVRPGKKNIVKIKEFLKIRGKS